nr:hypothetical protein [Lachnospira eligens]
MARMGGQSVAISMNELSNHDHSRFLTRTNRTVGRTNTLGPEAANNNVNKAVFKEAVVMQMTLPGALLYIMAMKQVCVDSLILITEELIHGDMRIQN